MTSYYPTAVRDEGLSYSVKSGEGIVTVSPAGVIRAIGVGTAVIEVKSKDNPAARSEFTVTAVSSGIIDFVNDRSDITALDDIASIKTVINPNITLLGYTLELFSIETGEPIPESVAVAELDILTGLISCRFIDTAYVGEVEIRLTVMATDGTEVTKSCYVNRISEIEIDWKDKSSDGRYDVHSSSSVGTRIEIDLRPLGADVSYFITLNYTSATDVVGNVTLGESFELAEGEIYVADGGFVSLEIESTDEGVFLIVRGEYQPTLSELLGNLTLTEISLSVRNNHDGTVTVLDGISVVVY